jgi:hypothetical protein
MFQDAQELLRVEGIVLLLALCAISVISYLYSILNLRVLGPKVPLVGVKSFLEARVVANYRFFKNAGAIVNEGYAKVSNFI